MGTLNYFKDGVWVSSDDPAGTIPQDVADQINDLVERPTVTYGSAPVSPKAGDVWIDSEGNKTKVFNGTVWVIAQDTDISGLAGSKNRVFLSPSTPIGTTGYTPVNGDLWIDSDDDNKIYIYNNTKFDVAPLGSAALADSLQTTINTASSQAASATSAIGDILSDDKVTPDEKYRLAKEWAVIDAERAGMASQATTYGIDTTDFNTATTSLDTLLNNATNGILLNMSSTSTISGQSVRVAFTDYYAQRTALLNAIYAKVKSIADSKTRAYYSDTMPTGLSFVNGDIWFDTNDDNRIYIYEDGFVPVEFGVNALARGTITKNTFGSDTTISNIIGVPTTTYSDLYNGFVTVAGAANSIRLNNVITENGSWTFSCMARRTGGAGNITVDICDGGTLTFTMGTDWSSVVLTHDVANFGASYHFVDIAFSAAGTFEFKQVQVEKGTRSTEWVPSATDLTNRIYQVKLSADSKNNIYYADVAPSSEIDNPYRTGDTWYHMVDVGGVKGIDGIWHFDATKGTGLKWSKEVLQNGVFGQLDAAKITTGFLSASRIDAGTITADKVVLSSGANLLQDPGFSKAELWDTTTCTIAPTAGMAGGPAAQLVTHATTPKYVHGLVERLNVARVIEGSNYRAGIWVKASNTVLASKIKLYGSWMDSKTAIKGTWNIVYGSALAANTWTHLSGLTGPVPSGASFSSFGLEVAATTAGVTITVSEPFLQQAAGAELIVDGAITTDKLSANAVTAAKIKANTITVNELASDVGTGLNLTSNTAITAKVSKDEVINQINLSPEAITISGNKINIDGALEISNWASGEDSTKIDGGSIYANSITANKLASDVGTGLDISSNTSITSRVTSTDMDAAINKLVMSITDYYALSTNPTTPPASGWGTTVPTWTDGSYIWHRQTILYKDTTSTETSPVNITGAMGKTGAAAINVLLSNESCSVPADNSGNVTSYVSTGTTIQLFEGATELTYDGTGTSNGTWKVVASGSNITPSSPTDSGQYATYGDHSAMALGSDTALITYTISGKRTNGTDFSILRSQNFTKSKAGSDGAASTSYWLVSDTLAIAKNVSNVYTPASITVSGKAQTGLNAPAAYAGRFIIAESTDGSTYVDKYPSAANESSKTYTPSAGITSVRIRMYLAGGTTTLLDEMIVPIVNDGATGARTAVLTMYRWSAASPTAYPGGTASTYTWANGTFTDPGTLNGWSRTPPAKVAGQTLWGISKTYTDTSTTATSSVTWNSTSPFAIGYVGTDGTNAKLISLTATTQTLTAPTTGGVTTPATAVVTGTAQATTITSWEYSVDGAAFSATVPTGVSRTNNVVTITGQTMTAKTIAVKMSDGTVSATLTVAKVTDGASGVNTSLVRIYARGTTAPALPSTTATYTFSSGALTGQGATWATTVPSSNGNPLWTSHAMASATAPTDTDTIAAGEWVAATKMAEDGASGSAGYNSTVLYLYQRSATVPVTTDIANPITYTFSSNSISGTLGAWSRTVPAGTNPLYVTSTYAYSNTATDTIANTEWSTPTVMAQNGATGTNGVSSSAVRIYKRAATSPTKPSTTSTYTFSTGLLTGQDNGWTIAVPVVDGNPLWTTHAIASATYPTDTDTIATGEWAAVTKMLEDGATGSAGYNSTIVYLYQRSASAPTKPSVSLTYTFSSGVLSGTLGSWTQTVPSGTNPLYVTTAYAYSNTATDSIAGTEWSNPVIMAQDGAAGAAGKVANIIASSQIFKSTDGGIVFSPDSIVLTPSLQIVTYSKWQYSTNGGTTWIDAESGSNGITIGTVNAVANCLTLVKTSALYTSAITSVVFKLVTNDTAVSDTVTISKLYDVADLKIGASNLVKNTSYLLTDATDGAVLGLGGVKVVGADPKTHTVRVSEALPAPPTGARSLYINNTSPSVENTSGVMQLIYGKVIANTNLILSFYTKASTAGSAWVKICNDNFSIVSAKKTFNLTTDWQLISIDMGTIPTAAENMRLMFGFGAAIPALGDNGHLISSIMLEYGTQPTNWFPAPQDFIDSIAAQTIISDTIKSEVLQTKALADTTARLLAEFDTEVSNTYSSVEQTSEAININLTSFYANTLSKTMTDIENTFKFTADGLKIAKSTSPYKVSIDNDSLDFLHIDPVSKVESEKATISGDGMKIPDAYISNSLHVGYHQVVKFDTGDAGNTVFRWIGEQ